MGGGMTTTGGLRPPRTPQTLAEKILSRVSEREVRAGDLVIAPVSRVMVHDSVIDAVMAGLRVPESIKVTFTGRLRKGITMKDGIMRVVREIGTDGARYACVEFHGVGSLPQGDRITLAGMTTEMGAKAGIVVGTPEAPDWLWPDPGAAYLREVTIDLTTLEPQIAVPPRVDQVVDVSAAIGQAVDIVFVGSCTNGRLVDMQQAAAVLRGRRIDPRVRLEVVPASRRQFELAMQDGTMQVLSAAGAVIGSSGCGPCLGRTGGVLAGEEICLSTANRNYRGRMGSADASIYLGSPYIAAVAALTGMIDDPRPYLEATDEEFDGIVAKSFARIFFRNCINLGIPVIESADANGLVRDGDEVTLDLTGGVLRTPQGDAALRPLAAFAREILDAGGVVAYLREHGDF